MKIWMTNIAARMRLQRVRSRFLTAMILIALPPLIVLGLISYNIAKDTLVQNHIQMNEDHLKTSSEVADLLFKNIINMNRLVLSNDELRLQLKASGVAVDNAQAVIDVRTANLLQNIVVSNLFDTQDIDSICLFDRKFRSVCYGRSERAGLYGSDASKGYIAQTEWYERAVEARGKEVFFGYDVLGESWAGNSFSSVKLLRDPNHLSGDTIGLLIINIKKTIFESTINESDESGFLVVDSVPGEAKIVYDHRPELTREIGTRSDLPSLLNMLQERGYITSQYTNRSTGWTFVHFMNAKALLKQSNRIGTATLLIASFIAIIALAVSVFISGSITRPLLQLKKMMVDWSKGSVSHEQAEVFEADEVGTIGATFLRITAENQQLNEKLLHSQLKEREAELRTLQAQIKPHFLYNTLDSIYWMAMLQNNQEIGQMAISLSESFKLSLNKGKETIPVFKELKHIEHYMIIQNIRYNNRFTYTESVEPEMMGLDIMKLLLQPLVENAIYHGLEPKVGPGTIKLTGRIDGAYVIFTVEDDGVGMADIAKTEQGYGLGNVRERLVLYYGEDSSFTIKSQVNEGTSIEMRFRIDAGKEG